MTVCTSNPFSIPSTTKGILQAIEQMEVYWGSPLDYFTTLSIREALKNAVEHGNKELPFKKVYVTLLDGKEERGVEIEDEGEGFDTTKTYNPTQEEHRLNNRGRGLFLMRHFAKEVLFMGKGNRVRLFFTKTDTTQRGS